MTVYRMEKAKTFTFILKTIVVCVVSSFICLAVRTGRNCWIKKTAQTNRALEESVFLSRSAFSSAGWSVTDVAFEEGQVEYTC